MSDIAEQKTLHYCFRYRPISSATVSEWFCCCSEGTEARLLSCVKEEISMERGQIEQLPEVTGFTSSTDGCVVTLQKQNGSNKSVKRAHISTRVCICVSTQGDSGAGYT